MDGIPAVLRAQLNLPEGIGVVVSFVAKGSPAEKAGLKANDVLTQMDDQLIVNAEQLQALIKGKKPGDAVSLPTIDKARSTPPRPSWPKAP